MKEFEKGDIVRHVLTNDRMLIVDKDGFEDYNCRMANYKFKCFSPYELKKDS